MNPKILPASIEAEKSLLGSLLVYPDAITTVFQLNLSPQEFFTENHKIIYQRILELNKNRKVCDLTTVSTILSNYGELELVGGLNYLYELTLGTISFSNIAHYCEIIQEKAQYRELIKTLDRSLTNSFSEQGDLITLLNSVEKDILTVTRTHRTSDFKTSEEVVDDVISQLESLKTNNGISGIKVNYPVLDAITNGFQRGDLIILAARPAMGKTAFALNLGLRASKNDNNVVAMFSLEMSADSLMKRLISSEGKIDSYKMRTGQFENDKEINQLYEAASRMKNYQIFIDETAGITMNEIFAKCRKLKADKGLDMIIIDYLQLITTKNSKSENRVLEVSQISRELKLLAREMDCPVIALSQLSRAVETRSNKRPMLSDLRESGSIEQDADLVIFLYRDDYYQNDESADTNAAVPIEVNIAKHRNGRTDTVKLAFDKKFSHFGSYTE